MGEFTGMPAISRIFIAWKSRVPTGAFSVRNGRLVDLVVHQGRITIDGDKIEALGAAPVILELVLEISEALYGKETTVVQWKSTKEPFAFLPATIPKTEGLAIPDFDVAIARTLTSLDCGKSESYAEVLRRGDFPSGREIGWEAWAVKNRRQPDVPTVLALSRDQRTFIVDPVNNKITASIDLTIPTIGYIIGRSSTPERPCQRSLDEGNLPILHSREQRGGILIEDTFFASFIDRPLTEASIAGTPLNISHLYSRSATFAPGRREVAQQEAATTEARGELVLFIRIRLTNQSDLPLLTPQHLPKAFLLNESKALPLDSAMMSRVVDPPRLDENGVVWTRNAPLSLHRVNGAVPTSLQPCVLLAPGESMVVESILSHTRAGLSESARAGEIPWESKLAETRTFWRNKLRSAAAISVPEKRLSDFWKAGFLHLELLTFGETDTGALLPKVGVYPPIGSESIPIVEFYDSVGLHDTARRCVDSFFELQHPDGRINLFNHYDIETGGALFMAGRHFAYTRDTEWVSRREGNLKLAADYLLGKRELGNPDAPHQGLVAGTCADPLEKTTSFMFNAYAAAGLLAVAEMLESICDSASGKYRKQAEEFICCYRSALARSLATGPVIPTGRSRWVPTCAPSIEGIGLEMMGLKGEAGFTHGAYTVFDALLGPLYGVFAGIIGPEEKFTQWLLEINHAQLNRACISESQPYYGRHPEVHLLRGEREPFLNAFYSGLTALADRDTFSFWEHLYQLTPHKTHEEAWALMQLRRMLWLECGRELRLLPGIPDGWLDRGNTIGIKGGGSYFGTVSFRVERGADANSINLCWEPSFHTPPERVRLYLPGILPTGQVQDRRLSVHSEDWVGIAEPAKPLNACLSLS